METIKTTIHGQTMQIALNRPDKKNALTAGMYSALVLALEQASGDKAVKSVVLHGNGDNFTSGNDLADFMAHGAKEDVVFSGGEAQAPVVTFLKAFSQFPKPIVVAVHGDVVGIGVTLLLHADLVFAHDNTRFILPFTKLGLCPEFGASEIMPRLLGHVKAFEWLVLGKPFTAEEAFTANLVNGVSDTPLSFAQHAADTLATLPPDALSASKALLRQSVGLPLAAVMKNELDVFSSALKGSEFAKAAASFLARSPKIKE